MNIHDFPYLNLDSLRVPGKDIAVSCETEEEAIHLLAALKVQHPTCCRTWDFPNVRWGNYSEMAYSPYINTDHAGLTYCSREHYEQHGFKVIPFKQLLLPEDQEIVNVETDDLLGLIF